MILSETKYIWYVKNANPFLLEHFKNITLQFFLQIDDVHVISENTCI